MVNITVGYLRMFQQFAKNNPSPPLDWGNPQVTRAGMDELTRLTIAALGPAEPAITEEYRHIPMRDGFQSEVKIARPSQPVSGGGPLIVYIFGGGYIAGSHDSGTAIARAFVRLFNATVVSISYRLAPEHKWPASWNDCWDTVQWLAEHSSEVYADPSKGFVIGGISAGGTLSAFITAESQTHKLTFPITGQWLCVPSLMNKSNVPARYLGYFHSLEHNKDAPVLPASAVDSLEDLVEWDNSSPKRWPVLYGSTILTSLPPTYLQADGADPLRDDSLIFHEMLTEAGVQAKVDLYPGCPHGHYVVMPGLEVSNRAFADLMINVGEMLGQNITMQDGLKAMTAT